jgi:hypothetical protein
MLDDLILVEGLHAKAEVVDVPCFSAWRCASLPPETYIDTDQVDHRRPSSKMDQT